MAYLIQHGNILDGETTLPQGHRLTAGEEERYAASIPSWLRAHVLVPVDDDAPAVPRKAHAPVRRPVRRPRKTPPPAPPAAE